MRGHWQRLITQLAILTSMSAVYLVDGGLFVNLVSISLVILPVATWTVFGVLLWLSNQAPDIESLHDRVDDALSASLGSTAAAVVGALLLLRLIGVITAPIGPFISIGIAFVVVTVSIPSLSILRTAVRVWLPIIQRRK